MNKFCVIGSKVTTRIDRTWFADQESAAKHGENLARSNYRSSGGQPITLYVVEVKAVVECGMPVVTVREPTDQDAAEAGMEADEEETVANTLRKRR